MSDGRGSTEDRHEAGRYEIRVRGHLDARWATWFDGLQLRHDPDGTTAIHGLVTDQAALHGLLQRVRDIGMPLISVAQTRPDERDPDPEAGPDHGAVDRPTERNDKR